jgi:TetR/AcrR family transcriptional regulator of autoinduction and epiphytic fitness
MTRTARKRADIVRAAREEFLTQGFRDTSMDRVAERADVSKRTVYNHFDSKEDLFRAITVDLIGEIHQAARVEYDPGAPLADQLHTIADREVDLVTSQNYLASFRVLLVESIALPGIAREALASVPEGQDPLAQWIRAAAGDGRLAVDDVAIAAQHFYSLLKGAFFWPVIAGYRSAPRGRERSVLIDSAIEMFLDHYGNKH